MRSAARRDQGIHGCGRPLRGAAATDLELDTTDVTPDESAARVEALLVERGFL